MYAETQTEKQAMFVTMPMDCWDRLVAVGCELRGEVAMDIGERNSIFEWDSAMAECEIELTEDPESILEEVCIEQ